MEGIPSVEAARAIPLPRNPFSQHKEVKRVLERWRAESGQSIRVSRINGFVDIGENYSRIGSTSIKPLLDGGALEMVAQAAQHFDDLVFDRGQEATVIDIRRKRRK